MNLFAFREKYELEKKMLKDEVINELTLYFVNKYICKFLKPVFVEECGQHKYKEAEPKFDDNVFKYIKNKLDDTGLLFRCLIEIKPHMYLEIIIYGDYDESLDFRFTHMYYDKKNLALPVYVRSRFSDYIEINNHHDMADKNNAVLDRLCRINIEAIDILDYFIDKYYEINKDLNDIMRRMYYTNYIYNSLQARTFYLCNNVTKTFPRDIAKIIYKTIIQ
jgi:hypothetical protein